MKNSTDVFSGLVILCFCAIGAVSVAHLPGPGPREVFGPAALPATALVLLALCALGIIVQGLRWPSLRAGRSDRKVILKVSAFFAFFIVYLVLMCLIGPPFYEQEDFPIQHSIGFSISTLLFVIVAMRLLGRTKLVEILGVSVLFTALLVGTFGWFFQVVLP